MLAELLGLTWNIWEISIISLVFALQMDISLHFSDFPLFLSNEGGNKWIIDETSGFYGICKISPEDLPKPCYLRDKETLNSSTQAKLGSSRFSSKHS